MKHVSERRGPRLGQVKGLWLRTVKAGRWPGGRAEPDRSGLYSSTLPFVPQIGIKNLSSARLYAGCYENPRAGTLTFWKACSLRRQLGTWMKSADLG